MCDVSVIVPTIGRPDSLRALLDSLCRQSLTVREVIVADGSVDGLSADVVADPRWKEAGLAVRQYKVHPPNAVRQRKHAISHASGQFLLLLDDDVVLESHCVEHMVSLLTQNQSVVAVVSDFNNQSWPMPTKLWRCYLKFVMGMKEGAWQGRVVGPLLRFGYNPPPPRAVPMEWIGAGNSMVRREAYDKAGGFSDFFLHRCTMNEDVDLGIKLKEHGVVMFCPNARMAHLHAPGGRVSLMRAAEDDLYNRYWILRHTLRRTRGEALGSVLLFSCVESLSGLWNCIVRLKARGFLSRLAGHMRAFCRILLGQKALWF